MTTYELDTLTLANIGEEVNDANRAEYSPLFLNAYNEAYFSLCAGQIKPTAGQTVALDGDKRFSPAILEQNLVPGGIVAVKKSLDYSGDSSFVKAREYDFHWTEDGKIAVPFAETNESVYVVYRYFPEALTNDEPTESAGTSSPQQLPEQYHGALSSYAASAYFRIRRKYERMQVWLETYLSAVRDLQGTADSGTLKLRNVFAPMP
jgi:hypothetical protein